MPPVKNQMTTSPLVVLRHRMSGMPLLTPVACTVQLDGISPRSADEAMVPAFMNQMTTSPVVVLRHRMSAKPSLLRSPVPAIVQLEGTTPRSAEEAAVPPTIEDPSALDELRAVLGG